MLGGLFVSAEVKLIIDVLNKLESFWNGPGFDIVIRGAEKAIRSNSQDAKTALSKGVSPKLVVLNYLFNQCYYDLSSGEHHLYRGALNPTGRDILRVFDLALRSLRELGDISTEDAQKQKAAMMDRIAGMG